MCEAEALSTLIASALHGHGHRPGSFAPFKHEQQIEWQRLFGQRPGARSTFWKSAELARCMPASGEDFDTLIAQLLPAIARKP